MVRRAKPSDAGRLAELHVTTWRQAYAGILPEAYLQSLSASQRVPMWKELLGSGDRAAVFVAEIEGEPIGFASGGRSSDIKGLLQRAEIGEMWTLYLLREFWGLGIGRQLHDTLLAELERKGFVEATLWVLDANERTRRWYETRGWQSDGSQRTAEVWGAEVGELRYRRMLGTIS